MVEWVLPVISGFVSAVVSAIVNLIFRWDEKRPKVKVVTSIGSWELRGSGKPDAIIFSAQNKGEEVTIKNYGLRIKKYIIFEEEVPEVLGLGFLGLVAYHLFCKMIIRPCIQYIFGKKEDTEPWRYLNCWKIILSIKMTV